MSTRVTSRTHLSLWFKFIIAFFGTVSLVTFGLVALVAGVALIDALPETSDKAYWFISRSSGVLAYLLLTFGVLWGLIQSSNFLRPIIPPLLALGLHSFLNWGGLVMGALHALILLGDNYIKMTLGDVVIPFIGPYQPLLVGLGIVGFYLMFLLASSFYARKWLGQKNFHNLHYASYPTYLLVTWHSLGVGTDSNTLWPLYAISLGAVALLTLWRVTMPAKA